MARRPKDPGAALRRLVASKIPRSRYWEIFFLVRYALTAEERDAYRTILSHMVPTPDPLREWGAERFLDRHPKLREAAEARQRALDAECGEWPKLTAEDANVIAQVPYDQADPPVRVTQHIIFPDDSPPPYVPQEPLFIREATEDDKLEIGALLDKPIGCSQGPPIDFPPKQIQPTTGSDLQPMEW